MITNVPTVADFVRSGVAYLNLAWDSTIALLLLKDDADLESEIMKDDINEFWQAAQAPLATALTLVHQGAEFLLKANISKVTPLLLISSSPNNWPRRCDVSNVDFANFRSLDAQDLIKVHNTVAEQRLPGSFIERFERLRSKRNTITHTVDRNLRVLAEEVIVEILEVSEHLISPQCWVELRKHHLENDHGAVAYGTDYTANRLAEEIRPVLDFLTTTQCKQYFGFNKRQRAYLCPKCCDSDWGYDANIEIAQLEPNDPKGTNLYCFCCKSNFLVSRQACTNEPCKGNVLYLEDLVCLTCGRSIES